MVKNPNCRPFDENSFKTSTNHMSTVMDALDVSKIQMAQKKLYEINLVPDCN